MIGCVPFFYGLREIPLAEPELLGSSDPCGEPALLRNPGQHDVRWVGGIMIDGLLRGDKLRFALIVAAGI